MVEPPRTPFSSSVLAPNAFCRARNASRAAGAAPYLLGPAGVGGDPVEELLLLGGLFGDEVVLEEALELALPVLQPVVEPLDQAGVADLDFLVALPGGLVEADEVLRVLDPPGHALLVGPELGQGVVAVGPARIAHDEGEVALLEAVERDLEPDLGLVGDVGRAEIGGRAVGGDVGPEEGEVAGVAGPHPVVRLAAEVAEVLGRGVDEADVADLLEGVEVVGVAAVHRGQGAAEVLAGLLARGDQVLRGLVEGVVALARRHLGLEVGVDLGRHVVVAEQDADRVALGRDLLAPRPGQEAVVDVVLLLARGPLDGAVGDVMVGQDEPFGADELARAAAEVDHGAHQARAVRLIEFAGVHPQPQRLEVEALHLVRHPHAVVRAGNEPRERGRGRRSRNI